MESPLAEEIAALQTPLKRLSKRFTTDSEESADLVQETILRALTFREKFREKTNLQGWLFTIMRNTFINNYRKNQRTPLLRNRTADLHLVNMPDPHTFSSPEGQYEWQDLWKHISALKEELVIPFKLHTSGYKYHEIADALELPIGTVKSRIFHARKEIQKRLV